MRHNNTLNKLPTSPGCAGCLRQKQAIGAVLLGAHCNSSSVWWVTREVHGNRHQDAQVPSYRTPQLTRDDITAASTLNSSSSVANLRRSEAVGETHTGLRQHGQTSRFMPEINCWSQVDDLTCDAASQTSRDGTNSPLSEQAERIVMRTGGNSCRIKAYRGLSERSEHEGETLLSNARGHVPQISPVSIHRCCPLLHSRGENRGFGCRGELT